MNVQRTNKRESEAGFTLVELAIVMIIIGLLIAGVLKGQEMIANAQVTSTVAQVKAIDAATAGFDDKYGALPGDIRNAADRLVNCDNAPCNASGDGNGRVEEGFDAAPSGEGEAFFAHLSAANLLSGVNPIDDTDEFGAKYPEAEVGGGFHFSYAGGDTELISAQGVDGDTFRSGHYLVLHNDAAGGVDTTGVITPNQAFRIDNKLDDGLSDAGSVVAAGAADCVDGSGYNEDEEVEFCNLYIRVIQ